MADRNRRRINDSLDVCVNLIRRPVLLDGYGCPAQQIELRGYLSFDLAEIAGLVRADKSAIAEHCTIKRNSDLRGMVKLCAKLLN